MEANDLYIHNSSCELSTKDKKEIEIIFSQLCIPNTVSVSFSDIHFDINLKEVVSNTVKSNKYELEDVNVFENYCLKNDSVIDFIQPVLSELLKDNIQMVVQTYLKLVESKEVVPLLLNSNNIEIEAFYTIKEFLNNDLLEKINLICVPVKIANDINKRDRFKKYPIFRCRAKFAFSVKHNFKRVVFEGVCNKYLNNVKQKEIIPLFTNEELSLLNLKDLINQSFVSKDLSDNIVAELMNDLRVIKVNDCEEPEFDFELVKELVSG